jgi:hypothetical protein
MPVHRASSNPRCPVVAFQHELDAWIAHATKASAANRSSRKTPVVLSSWKEIAAYLHRAVRSVQRWEAILGMPVGRLGSMRHAPVVAFQHELDGRGRGASAHLPVEHLGLSHYNSPNPHQLDYGFIY